MSRITVWDEQSKGYVAKDPALAMEHLAHFEDLLEYLNTQQKELPRQIAALREEGRERSYRFRELLGQKMLVESMLSKMKEFGIV